jgi:hypothetical protein
MSETRSQSRSRAKLRCEHAQHARWITWFTFFPQRRRGPGLVTWSRANADPIRFSTGGGVYGDVVTIPCGSLGAAFALARAVIS